VHSLVVYEGLCKLDILTSTLKIAIQSLCTFCKLQIMVLLQAFMEH
jgi:hypothetical protein